MGASGCKLRSAEERRNNKRLRLADEDALDDVENTDPNEAKKARAEEPTDYQKGLQEWRRELAADRLIEFIAIASWSIRRGRGMVEGFCNAASNSWVDLNYDHQGSSIFSLILYAIERTLTLHHGVLPPGDLASLEELLKNLASKVSKVSKRSIDANLLSLNCTPLCSIASMYMGATKINVEALWAKLVEHSDIGTIQTSTVGLQIANSAESRGDLAFKLLRDLHARGCDLNSRSYDGGTILHRIVSAGAGQCLLLWAQVDFVGFDWQIRDTNDRNPMQLARCMASGSDASMNVFKMMQKWDNRWRSVTRVELDVHLPPDLSKMICEYLDGTGKPFKSREEEKKQEAEEADLQRMLDGDNGEEEEEKCSKLDDEDFLRSIVDGTAQGEDEAAPFVAPDMLA